MRSDEANRLDVMLRMQLAYFPARDHLCVIGLDAEVAHVRTRRTVECASACFAYESKLTEVLHPSSFIGSARVPARVVRISSSSESRSCRCGAGAVISATLVVERQGNFPVQLMGYAFN